MKLNNLGLIAFYQCALLESMTEAAAKLGVTQSALSQRVSQLENELETALFVREGKSLSLTQSGEELFRYCQGHESLENEILSKLSGDQDHLAGSIRIAAYSSIMRSLVIDKLSSFVRENNRVQVDLQCYEVIELEKILKTGKADLVICDYSMNKIGILEKVVGEEEFVVIESSKYKTNSDIYLDHGAHDNATTAFFDTQKKAPVYKRSFMGDVYAIIDGVERGFGRAVMSRHLVEGNKKIKIISGYKKYKRPIIVHYYDRPYYSDLFKQVLKLL